MNLQKNSNDPQKTYVFRWLKLNKREQSVAWCLYYAIGEVLLIKDGCTAQNNMKCSVCIGSGVGQYADYSRFRWPIQFSKNNKKSKLVVGPDQLGIKKGKKNLKWKLGLANESTLLMFNVAVVCEPSSRFQRCHHCYFAIVVT